MSFDERQFLDMLAGIDSSLHKIKQIANYIIYHREMSHEKIVDAWSRQFHSVPPESKILLLYVGNEVIIQTSRKGKMEYVKDFADAFVDCFKDIIRRTESVDILNTLHNLCDMWENELVYANNFMELLRKWIRSRISELQGTGEEPGVERLNSAQGDLKFITKWDMCTQNFTMDIQEENIKNIYDSVDKDRLNLHISNSSPDSATLKEMNDYEEKLKGLRNLLITDISKREKFIFNLSDFLQNEKETYFSYLDESKVNN